TSRRAPDESRREGQNAEDEEVNVVRPAHNGKKCHRPEDDHETPVIDRSGGWMSADSLRTEHGDHARDDANKARRDVYADRSEEKWRRRRDRNPENPDALVDQESDSVAPPNGWRVSGERRAKAMNESAARACFNSLGRPPTRLHRCLP